MNNLNHIQTRLLIERRREMMLNKRCFVCPNCKKKVIIWRKKDKMDCCDCKDSEGINISMIRVEVKDNQMV